MLLNILFVSIIYFHMYQIVFHTQHHQPLSPTLWIKRVMVMMISAVSPYVCLCAHDINTLQVTIFHISDSYLAQCLAPLRIWMQMLVFILQAWSTPSNDITEQKHTTWLVLWMHCISKNSRQHYCIILWLFHMPCTFLILVVNYGICNTIACCIICWWNYKWRWPSIILDMRVTCGN